MKKTKLKVKKGVWILLIIVIFLAIALYSGKKIYADYQYKQTTEYKLLQLGYTMEEIKLLNEKTNEEIIDTLLSSQKNDFLISLINENYYLNNYITRYLQYHDENQSLSAKDVITYVNTNNDYSYYELDKETDLNQEYLILVNKFYHLESTYEPNDLVDITSKYYYGSNHKIRKAVYEAFIEMWNAANEEGIYLIINSAYRNYQEQEEVYNYYKDSNGTSYADSIAARPGYSEHQTGLSLDIFSKDNTTTSNFGDSKAYTWLTNNAYKYGFIQRYQEGKENITGFAAESWHWRYVGVSAATYIHDNDITFDEYYAYFIENSN